MEQRKWKLCLLNIGNSNVQKVFLDDSGRPACPESIPAAKFSAASIPAGIPVAAASVVPRFDPLLQEKRVFRITRETPGGVDYSAVDSSTVGADRIANAAAMTRAGLLPAVSVDCGTAVNLEIVAPGGRFLGGAILPGRMLMRKALNDYTAKLPLIDFYEELPEFPGKNTRDALRIGTDFALVAAIRGVLEEARRMFGTEPAVYFCGGDREFFRKQIGVGIDGGEFFTLRGVLAIWEYYQ